MVNGQLLIIYVWTFTHFFLEVVTKNAEQDGIIRQFQENGRISTGNTYIRWGHTTCPLETRARVLYDGYVAGSHFQHTGGGSNYLCLPRDPDLVNIVGGGRSILYGAEYETLSTDVPLNNLHDEEVPCAVCYTPNTNVIMIPAKGSCHDGWVLEYSGFLMSESYSHSGRTTHVCVDGEAEKLDGSYGSQNGALFYFVETRCGSLPCGPYRENYELTCTVCSLPPAMVVSGSNSDAWINKSRMNFEKNEN